MSAHRQRRITPVSGKAAVAIAALAILSLVGAGTYAAIHMLHARGGSDHTAEFGFVQETVKAKIEGTAYFHPIEEASFETAEDGKLRVTGEVNVMAPNGTFARYSYTVVMHQGPDGNWIADDVSIVPV